MNSICVPSPSQIIIQCMLLNGITDNFINRLMQSNKTRMLSPKLLFHAQCMLKLIHISINRFLESVCFCPQRTPIKQLPLQQYQHYYHIKATYKAANDLQFRVFERLSQFEFEFLSEFEFLYFTVSQATPKPCHFKPYGFKTLSK